LCLLEIGEDYRGMETTPLRDKDGVFRDSEVWYDGRRIQFSSKKSAREDDYHLHSGRCWLRTRSSGRLGRQGCSGRIS
jgi:hypothetical protein